MNAPVGYALRGKQWLEHDNPYAVGLTGLLGYGGAYGAINHADLLLMLGTDFPFSEFLPGAKVRKVQIDQNPKHIGRRTSLDLGLVGDVKATLQALLENVQPKTDDRFLRKYVAETESFAELKQHYVDKGPGIKPIRPEYLAATLCKLASDDAMFFADTGHGSNVAGEAHQRWQESEALRIVLLGFHGQRRAERVWSATGLSWPPNDSHLRRRRVHDACDGRPADPGRTKETANSTSC